MNAVAEKTITVKLFLSEEEARWLIRYVQNSFTSPESKEDQQMREALFNALHNEQIKP